MSGIIGPPHGWDDPTKLRRAIRRERRALLRDDAKMIAAARRGDRRGLAAEYISGTGLQGRRFRLVWLEKLQSRLAELETTDRLEKLGG